MRSLKDDIHAKSQQILHNKLLKEFESGLMEAREKMTKLGEKFKPGDKVVFDNVIGAENISTVIAWMGDINPHNADTVMHISLHYLLETTQGVKWMASEERLTLATEYYQQHPEFRSDMPEDHEIDSVNHPPHYTNSKAQCSCGRTIECIDVVRHLDFNIGNAIKYLWRWEQKGGSEDLKKAIFYIEDRIKNGDTRSPPDCESFKKWYRDRTQQDKS